MRCGVHNIKQSNASETVEPVIQETIYCTLQASTWSVSSILNVILPRESPTLLKSLITPALDKADVLVDLGRSPEKDKTKS